jgi:hypothetical protein
MDSLLRRLKFYGIGFSIGLVFVLIFFQNRGCSWLPSNRIKNSFLDRVIVLPENEANTLKKLHLTHKDIINVLNDGDVVFSKSLKKGKTKVYHLEKEFDNKGLLHFFFTLPDESFISEVHISEHKATQVKNTLTGSGEILHFPKDDNLVFVDSSQFVTCQQSELGLINPIDILKLMKKQSIIDFSKTNYKASPKAVQYIQSFDKKHRLIGAHAIWYKNKINITDFVLPFKSNCN